MNKKLAKRPVNGARRVFGDEHCPICGRQMIWAKEAGERWNEGRRSLGCLIVHDEPQEQPQPEQKQEAA